MLAAVQALQARAVALGVAVDPFAFDLNDAVQAGEMVEAVASRFGGIYVASTIFIAFFMLWLGKYSWAKSVGVALGVSVVFFLLFEVWFKVPLPKGPLEAALGLN